ncbi:MAG: LysM peptidoglycan-binding domain-containing protein [Acidobacteriota bacterium]
MRSGAAAGWCCFLAVLLGFSVPASAGTREDLESFPSWPDLEFRIAFWTDIYTRYTTRQAVVHDAEFPQVVYGVVDLGGFSDGGRRVESEEDRKIMERARTQVQDILLHLEDAGRRGPGPATAHGQVMAALAAVPAEWRLAGAAGRVRTQRGQADRFRLSLVRSGRYLESYRQMAQEENVPEDLIYIPHVESSFETGARSHVGAAGLWQFIPSTARRFLTIDMDEDQRLDPWFSARAAFRLLRENRDVLGTWPLAITAYNYGQAGMSRAVRQYGTDLARIIRSYQAPRFGFASKNFYAEFLAARRIARDREAWFGPLQVDPPLRFETFRLPQFVSADTLSSYFGLPLEDLQRLNPALDARVWSGDGLLPGNHDLRVPPGSGKILREEWSRLPESVLFDRVEEDIWHRVRRGENLSLIARRYHTTVSRIQALNHLSRARLIFAGQRLKVRRIRRIMPLPAPVTAHDGMETGGDSTRYVVKSGDTLYEIGRRCGVALNQLIRINRLRDASRLAIGQILILPRCP